MKGRVVVITGATGSIGAEIALGLAFKGATLILLGRNVAKTKAAAETMTTATGNSNISVEECDLSSYYSIQRCCERLRSKNEPIHVLINNAGLATKEKQKSVDGIELQFAVNVLAGHWLTRGLRGLLEAGAGADAKTAFAPRVVNVASKYAGDLDLADLEFKTRQYKAHIAYKQSKQANRMMTYAWADRLTTLQSPVLVHCCHPGIVSSKLLRDLGFPMGFSSARSAAQTPVHLATASKLTLGTGLYWSGSKVKHCEFKADTKAIEDLWEACTGFDERCKHPADTKTSKSEPETPPMRPAVPSFTCRCGAVTATCRGGPDVCVHCHCRECRALCGTPFITAAVYVDAKRVEITRGKARENKRTEIGSGGFVTRSCEACGERLFHTNKTGFAIVALEKARNSVSNALPAGLNPTMHLYYAERTCDVSDTLPKYLDKPEAFGGSGRVDDGGTPTIDAKDNEAKATSDEAKVTSDEAKATSNEAKATSNEAKGTTEAKTNVGSGDVAATLETKATAEELPPKTPSDGQ